MRKKEIVQLAQQFCRENRVHTHPVKIIELCESLGISVFEQYLPPEVSGFIVIQEKPFDRYNTGRLIVINQADTAKRRRFTIAHELAHYILHRPEDAPLYAHRDAGQNGGIETEANIFASNVLMPEDLVRKVLKNYQDEFWGELPADIKVELISKDFAVSLDAARVRLESLDLI